MAMTMGMVAVAALAARGARRPVREDEIDVRADELRSERGQAIVVVLGPADLDDDRLAFEVPALTQPVAKGIDEGAVGLRRRRAEHTDAVHLPAPLAVGQGRDGEEAAGADDESPPGKPISLRRSHPRKSRLSVSHICAESLRLSVSTRSLWPWNITGYSVYGMRSE